MFTYSGFSQTHSYFLHLLIIACLWILCDYFWKYRKLIENLLHTFCFYFPLCHIAGTCSMIYASCASCVPWLLITLGQELLHHFGAPTYPWVCPHPELREGHPLWWLHTPAWPLRLPPGRAVQVSGYMLGHMTTCKLNRERNLELPAVLI